SGRYPWAVSGVPIYLIPHWFGDWDNPTSHLYAGCNSGIHRALDCLEDRGRSGSIFQPIYIYGCCCCRSGGLFFDRYNYSRYLTLLSRLKLLLGNYGLNRTQMAELPAEIGQLSNWRRRMG